jgi:hypothetical protein
MLPMKTMFLSLGILSLSIGISNAQWKFYVAAGPSFANFSGSEKKDWGGTNTNPKMVIRFHGGITAERILSEKLVAGGGIQLSTKGTMYKGTVDYYNPQTFNLEKVSIKYNKALSYIDVPIYIKYVASQKLYLLAGLQPGILVRAKIKNDEGARKAYPSLPKKEDAKDYYNTFDLAVLLGPQYEINEKFFVQLLYNAGLLKIARGEEYSGNSMIERNYKVLNSVFKLSFICKITSE